MELKRLLLLALTAMLSACTTSVVVEGSAPTPLVKKIPANVAVYFSEEFKTFTHEESIEQAGNWKIDLGNQNLDFFRNLINSMFTSVIEIDSAELTEAQQNSLDGLVIPVIDKYGFLTPAVSGLKFYSASIHYKISVLDNQNNKLADYTVVGYGKSEGGTFGAGKALGEATRLAIRDGGTRIAVDLSSQPTIKKWLAEKIPGAQK
ncbi:MAG: hypothetical protein KUG79_10730 [Pseudomonadales bacterium]|nr:hypothetical protein [Pseudomonadales bacterium]